jgi:GTPase SAR1 family protein
MKKKIGKSNISNVSNDMIKVVILGDGTVGKTCLTLTYSTNKFPTKYGKLILIIFQKSVNFL